MVIVLFYYTIFLYIIQKKEEAGSAGPSRYAKLNGVQNPRKSLQKIERLATLWRCDKSAQ